MPPLKNVITSYSIHYTKLYEDVVKQNLEKIKGKVEVQSKPGIGTRITLRIPLTLAIIDGIV